MNKSRRLRLSQAVEKIVSGYETIEEILEEESDALDNIPENLQFTDKYQQMEDCVDYLEQSADSLEEAIESLKEAQQC